MMVVHLQDFVWVMRKLLQQVESLLHFCLDGPNGPIASTADSIGSLCGGNYNVTITDASGCDTIVPFTILPGRTIYQIPILLVKVVT